MVVNKVRIRACPDVEAGRWTARSVQRTALPGTRRCFGYGPFLPHESGQEQLVSFLAQGRITNPMGGLTGGKARGNRPAVGLGYQVPPIGALCCCDAQLFRADDERRACQW